VSLGEVWWLFDRAPQIGAARLLDLLERRGLGYRNPSDGLIYVLDEDGGRRQAPLEFVLSQWMADRELTMQTWLDPDTDVIVEVTAGGLCLTFDLDGLLRDEANRVVSALLLCAGVVDGTRALVVDRYLPDRGPEWLHALESGSGSLPADADLLLLADAGGALSLSIGAESWLRVIDV
jgi:hypothetical protein